MTLLGIDLGGTKLALAIFAEQGKILCKETIALKNSKGEEAGKPITDQISKFLHSGDLHGDEINSIGIAVPGISNTKTRTVWAPNIPEWNNYPLLKEVKNVTGEIPVTIDSDRACYISGELWQGKARGDRDAIFLARGTGIGAGMLTLKNLSNINLSE